jgi:hypothetical protein
VLTLLTMVLTLAPTVILTLTPAPTAGRCGLQPIAPVAIRTKRVVRALLAAAIGPAADDGLCPGSRWMPSGSRRCGGASASSAIDSVMLLDCARMLEEQWQL